LDGLLFAVLGLMGLLAAKPLAWLHWHSDGPDAVARWALIYRVAYGLAALGGGVWYLIAGRG
jgi:hypothetical protein